MERRTLSASGEGVKGSSSSSMKTAGSGFSPENPPPPTSGDVADPTENTAYVYWDKNASYMCGIFLLLLSAQLLGVYLFANGFFPKKTPLEGYSKLEDILPSEVFTCSSSCSWSYE